MWRHHAFAVIVNFLGLVPVNITWLGRIDSNNTAKIMALVSICLNVIVIICAAVKCKHIGNSYIARIVEKALPFVFWWLVGNSIANLFSKSSFEVVVFTPLLIILTVCVYVLMKPDSSKNKLAQADS